MTAFKQSEEAPKKTEEAPKKPAPVEDDDDLFGSDTEEEKEAAKKLREKKIAEAQATKPAKKAVIAKSIIVFDVKVYEQEQDLKALAEKIFSTINMDGLVWNKDIKVVPVAFGMC